MSVKTINVSVGNNLNAIVKGGVNVDAVVTFKPSDMLPFSTSQIRGGQGEGPYKLEYNTNNTELVISAYANTLGEAPDKIVQIPLDSNDLVVNLEGTYNGKIDIQTTFK